MIRETGGGPGSQVSQDALHQLDDSDALTGRVLVAEPANPVRRNNQLNSFVKPAITPVEPASRPRQHLLEHLLHAPGLIRGILHLLIETDNEERGGNALKTLDVNLLARYTRVPQLVPGFCPIAPLCSSQIGHSSIFCYRTTHFGLVPNVLQCGEDIFHREPLSPTFHRHVEPVSHPRNHNVLLCLRALTGAHLPVFGTAWLPVRGQHPVVLGHAQRLSWLPTCGFV